jgi:hypothetical protein
LETCRLRKKSNFNSPFFWFGNYGIQITSVEAAEIQLLILPLAIVDNEGNE